MYTREQILYKLRENKPELKKKYSIAELGLFGSYARGEAKEDSDIDVLVSFDGPIGMEFIQMVYDLEAIFNQKVDLVSRRAIKPRMLPFIEKDILYV
ncbi:nucleotidyltransferase family protein [soil metagenome]